MHKTRASHEGCPDGGIGGRLIGCLVMEEAQMNCKRIPVKFAASEEKIFIFSWEVHLFQNQNQWAKNSEIKKHQLKMMCH